MSGTEIALTVVAALLALGVVWLLIERAGMIARASAAMGEVQTTRGMIDAERERWQQELAAVKAAAAAEEAGLERRAEELSAEVRVASVALAQRTEQHEGDQRRHALELRQASESLAKQRAEFEALQRDYRASVEKRDAELHERFKALASDALKDASASFLSLASQKMDASRERTAAEVEQRKAGIDALLRPMGETLARTDAQLAALKQEWAADRAKLAEEVRGVREQGEGLKAETLRLTRALSKPEVRGRYGEIQLRRVAELAGMAAYCDFEEQATTRDAQGRAQRPDMIVRLPNDRTVVVDAKTNTAAYLEAIEAPTPEAREACLDRFARHVAEQVGLLAGKSYWSQLDGSADFVVMFVPGDQFLDAALARRGDLLEKAAEQGVVLASPSTLIGLLRAVHVGWREKRVADQARELFELGKQLHERAAVAFEKIARLGKALDQATTVFNEFVGSYETRLEPALRRFEEAGVKSGKELPAPAGVTVKARFADKALFEGRGER